MATGTEIKHVTRFFHRSWAARALSKVSLASTQQPAKIPEHPVAKGRASQGSVEHTNQLGKHKSAKEREDVAGQETSSDTAADAVRSNTHTPRSADRAAESGTMFHSKSDEGRTLLASPIVDKPAPPMTTMVQDGIPGWGSRSHQQLQVTKQNQQTVYILPILPKFDSVLLWYHSTYPTGISFSHPGRGWPNSADETRVTASLLRCGDKIFFRGNLHYFCSASAALGSRPQVVKSIDMVNMQMFRTTVEHGCTIEMPVVDYLTFSVQDFSYVEGTDENKLVLAVKRFGETEYTTVYLPVTAAVNESLLIQTLKHERDARRTNPGTIDNDLIEIWAMTSHHMPGRVFVLGWHVVGRCVVRRATGFNGKDLSFGWSCSGRMDPGVYLNDSPPHSHGFAFGSNRYCGGTEL